MRDEAKNTLHTELYAPEEQFSNRQRSEKGVHGRRLQHQYIAQFVHSEEEPSQMAREEGFVRIKHEIC